MKNSATSLLAAILLLFIDATAAAGYRAVIEVEEIEDDTTEKSIETITFDKNRFRIAL
jgi:hypothetical protein